MQKNYHYDMLVWILTDNRIGSNNQSIAVGESLSDNCVKKNIVYNKFIFLPNLIRQNTLLGINRKKSDNIYDNLPDVVICAGRRLSSVALNIKKRSKGKAFVINIMHPNLNFGKFDLVILPKHDCTSSNILNKYQNIIETNGTLNRVNREKIAEENNKWNDFFKDYKHPLFSLIIGGDTKDYKFNPDDFGNMVKKLSDIVSKVNGSLLITTSRRTSDLCVEKMKSNLHCEYYLYDWKFENDEANSNKNELGNPYYALLGISDFLIITGDSMSMVSEGCSTGKPVYIYMPENSMAKKHKLFCNNLIQNGLAKEFNNSIDNIESYEYTPLDEISRIKNIINSKLR